MKDFIDFFSKVGKLEKMSRRGGVLIGIKKPQTIGGHIYRVAIMSWFLGKEKKAGFNTERILKLALVHDLCELYAGDTTPYDFAKGLPRDKRKWPQLFDKWPRFTKAQKAKYFNEKRRKERASLKKVINKLPKEMQNEALHLWEDYAYGKTKEARFVHQVNRIETLLQALEYARESKKRPYNSWWLGSKEKVDDSLLIDFMKSLEREFYDEDNKIK